ncbi:MAG TPA: serine/threonine-protein kinase, partial [Polyangium sp.]|nr:serine/threonine-protein kinase [Polyangium sp.]
MNSQHQPGDVVKNYRIVRTLGRGGAATTYEAQEIDTGKAVALKVLELRGLDDWKKLELFEREATTLKALNHPSIPRYVDSFQVEEDGPKFYLIQELAPGRSLAEIIAGGFHPDEAEVRRIAEQLLRILRYLESRVPPVVHRDIKPHNVIRSDTGEIYLVDFGAVNDVRRQGEGSTVVGTYGYMAPEQLRGQATTAGDLYGLGATLVYLLTRRSPAELPQKKLKIDISAHARISR